MIATIGIMIGTYILTRMFELMGNPDSRTAAKAFAAITVVVTVISIISFLVGGSHTPEVRPY